MSEQQETDFKITRLTASQVSHESHPKCGANRPHNINKCGLMQLCFDNKTGKTLYRIRSGCYIVSAKGK